MENVKFPGGQSSSKLLNHFLRLTSVVLWILRLFWYVWKSVVIPPLTCANNHQELWSLQRSLCVPLDERHLMMIKVCILFILFLLIFSVFFTGPSGLFVAVFLNHYIWNLPLPSINSLYVRGSKEISSKWSGVLGDKWAFTQSLVVFIQPWLWCILFLLLGGGTLVIPHSYSLCFSQEHLQPSPGKIVMVQAACTIFCRRVQLQLCIRHGGVVLLDFVW